jgi:IrrE N-terminal-like domain
MRTTTPARTSASSPPSARRPCSTSPRRRARRCPRPCGRLAGDDPLGSAAALAEVARSLGFVVEDHAFTGATNGDCSHALRRIRLRAGLAPAHRVKTLAHELAHALLHAEVPDRAVAELEAESVAFIVCDALGIDARRLELWLRA